MKYFILFFVLMFLSIGLFAQEGGAGKTRLIIGLSGPELIHAGLTHRVANFSQFGLSGGAGPTWGGVWPTINFEHRLYIGSGSDLTTSFVRQGTTFFPVAKKPQRFTLTLTIGKGLKFSDSNNGLTIDLGVF